MSIEDGGPAFPLQDWDPCIQSRRIDTGMSLRDYFAAKVMHAALVTANGGSSEDAVMDAAAKIAYRMADLMLKAREVKS